MRNRIGKLISKVLHPYQFEIHHKKSLYDKISELEQRICILEQENVETANTLYEIYHSIDAVDARIDILTAENYGKGT